MNIVKEFFNCSFCIQKTLKIKKSFHLFCVMLFYQSDMVKSKNDSEFLSSSIFVFFVKISQLSEMFSFL